MKGSCHHAIRRKTERNQPFLDSLLQLFRRVGIERQQQHSLGLDQSALEGKACLGHHGRGLAGTSRGDDKHSAVEAQHRRCLVFSQWRPLDCAQVSSVRLALALKMPLVELSREVLGLAPPGIQKGLLCLIQCHDVLRNRFLLDQGDELAAWTRLTPVPCELGGEPAFGLELVGASGDEVTAPLHGRGRLLVEPLNKRLGP